MKRMMALLLMLCMLLAFGAAACAQTVSQDGLTATLTTDKRSYNEGESVSVSLTLGNTTADEIHLTDAYYILPDFLGGGVAPINLHALAAGQSVNLGAVFTVAVPPQAGTLPDTGDGAGQYAHAHRLRARGDHAP